MRQRIRREQGFALVLVLWIGLLIAIIGSSLLREAESASVGAASDAATFQATIAADGGINCALLNLIDRSDPERWRIDGTARTLHFLNQFVTVRVGSENGKIDLNAASANLLSALFRSAQISVVDGQTLAERIVAWRTQVPSGAIDSTANIYRDAGRSYGPRHGPFRSAGELRMVLGMTDNLQSLVNSALTVYSKSATVDRGVASDDVLRILQSAGDGFAAAQLSARARGNAAGGDRLPVVGEALSIWAKAESHGAVVERIAVIRLTGDASYPYTILEWH